MSNAVQPPIAPQSPEPAPETVPVRRHLVDREGRDAERPKPHPDPTRYGDWEKNGRCIDF